MSSEFSWGAFLATSVLTALLVNWLSSATFTPLASFFRLHWLIWACAEISKFLHQLLNRPYVPVIKGGWKQTWSFVGSENYPPENYSTLEARSIGSWVAARWRAKGKTGEDREYRLDGEFEPNSKILSGKWYAVRRGGYSGVFEGKLFENESSFNGKWIGASGKDGAINAGDWTWVFPSLPES